MCTGTHIRSLDAIYMTQENNVIPSEYLVTLFQLKLPKEPLTLEIEGNFRLSNNSETIENFFTGDAISIAGINEVKQTYQLSTFLTYEEKHPINGFDEKKSLISVIQKASLFCQALWLVKDNAVRTELSHLKFKTPDDEILHSNFISAMYTNALAEKETVEFSLDELHEAIKYFSTLYEISFIELSPFTNLRQDITRITRAFYFLQSARICNDIGTKISQYCTAFECLFSTSNSELKHRLSETIAFFLNDDSNNAREIYKKMQLAYDLRSSVVHGDHISSRYTKNDFKQLKETAIGCDMYFRQSLRKIIDNKSILELYTSGNNEKIKEFLTDLIFSKSS